MSVGIERTGTPVLMTRSVLSAFVISLGLSAAGSFWLLHLDAGPARFAAGAVAMAALLVLAQEAPQRAMGSGRLDNRPQIRMAVGLTTFALVLWAYDLPLVFPITGVVVAAVHIARSGSMVWRPAIALTTTFTVIMQLLVQLRVVETPVPLAYAHVIALVSLAMSAVGIANLGLTVGVTERANRKTREAERRFRLLVQSSTDAVTVLDADGRFSYAGPASAGMLAMDAEDLIGTRLDDLIDPEDVTDCHERIATLLAGPDDAAMRWEVRGRADGPTWLELSARSLPDEGEPAVLLSFRDVSERRVAQDELSHAATHDHLTGLKTRREFLRQASRATSAASPKMPVALLFCDLDGFKGVNDVYGHAAGDEVLRAIAARLRRTVRPTELIGRLGGDEFAVLMPGPVDADAVSVIIERLQAAVSPAITLHGGGAVRIGMSIGQTIVTTPTPDAETVLPQADRAMYAAKFAGRLSVESA